MGIGTKRICQSCAAKFYDLEKDPIICPKCNTVYSLEAALKPKRGRKKAGAKPDPEEEEIEISLDDEVIEEMDDDAAIEEIDEEMREEIGVDEEESRNDKKDNKVLVDLEEDNDDIIESDDAGDKD